MLVWVSGDSQPGLTSTLSCPGPRPQVSRPSRLALSSVCGAARETVAIPWQGEAEHIPSLYPGLPRQACPRLPFGADPI